MFWSDYLGWLSCVLDSDSYDFCSSSCVCQSWSQCFNFCSALASPSRLFFSIYLIFCLLFLPCCGLELMMEVMLLVFLFSLVYYLYSLRPLGIFEQQCKLWVYAVENYPHSDMHDLS